MWRLKALIQFVFAHLPFGEQLNYFAQRLRGAYKDSVQSKRLIIQSKHLGRCNSRLDLEGKTAIEIGSGWNGIGCLLLYLLGIKTNYSFDHKKHMRYRLLRNLINLAAADAPNLSELLGVEQSKFLERIERLENCRDIESLHREMGVSYCAPGDAARTGLPDNSVDFVFSYGVLEHVPEESLREMFVEQKRILSPTGRAYHNIGIHDHFHTAGLGNGVNFLRYSERFWAFFCYNDILYHNRLRLPHYLQLIDDAGLQIVWHETELLQLNLDALKRIKVHEDFAGLSDVDLATSHLYVDLAA